MRHLREAIRQKRIKKTYIEFIKVKYETRKLIRECKKKSWISFCESINTNTSSSEIFRKIRSLKGFNMHFSIPALEINDTIISNKQDIVNELADTFTANSSSLNYSQSFLKSKNYKEKITLNVNNNDESYNDNFSMVELISTLRMCKGSSPGPDLIHYEMLKNLSVENKKYLLDCYIFIWQKQTFPDQWREAIVIPIPKKRERSFE